MSHKHLIVTLNDVSTTSIAQFQHLVYQIGNAVGILHDILSYLGLLMIIKFHPLSSKHLRESAQYVQRSSYLVRNLLDEAALHLR